MKFRRFFDSKDVDESRFSFADIDGIAFRTSQVLKQDATKAKVFSSSSLSSTSGGDTSRSQFEFRGKRYLPAPARGWRCSLAGLKRLAYANRILAQGNTVRYKYFHDDFPYVDSGNLWINQMSEQNKAYVVQTSPKAIERCVLMTTDPGDLF